MYGTASTVTNWILLEQPGSWGYTALLDSRIPAGTSRTLWRHARDRKLRIVLVRRPSDRRKPDRRHCYLVHTGPETPWMECLELNNPEDLLHLDLDPMAEGQAPDLGRSEDGRLFLICTNGRRDPCCAERGRPLAAALAPAFGRFVWECSHIGGDRFAGNLVCFPHGIYFGRVGPEEANSVARAYAEGQLSLNHYRGRSCYPFDVQAAEYFVRRRLGLTGIDEVKLVERTEEEGRWIRVTFFARGRSVTTVVQSGPALPPRPLTCHSVRLSRPPSYEVLEK